MVSAYVCCMCVFVGKERKGHNKMIQWGNTKWYFSPPNDAATATDPATVPAALAAAANPLAPITGIKVPKVGASALRPAAIAGAARPVPY